MSTTEWIPPASIEASRVNPEAKNFDAAIARFAPIATYTDRFGQSMATQVSD